jgi:PAS domain S-box-containing protein
MSSNSKLYAALFENSPQAILIADDTRRYVDANPAACRLLGLSREQVQQHKVDDFAAPERRDDISRAWEAFLRDGHQSGEYELVRSDRAMRRVEFQATANFLPGLHLSMLRDITEKHLVETETEERFRLTFNQAAVGMSYASLHGDFTRINQKLAEFLGYPAEELLTMNFRDVTHPDDLGQNVREVEELIAGMRDRFLREKRYIRKDGSTVWGKVSSSLLRRSDGSPAYAFSVIEDISERKRAEEEVRFSRERLAVAMSAAHAGSFEWDFQRNRILWSPEMERLYGLVPGEFTATSEHWLSLMLSDDRSLFDAAVRSSQKTGEFDAEWRIRRSSDSQVRWLAARAKVIFDRFGTPVRMIGINVDITERKHAEDSLRRSHLDLERQVEARTAALRSLSSHLLRAQDEERRRIARELHDSLGQYLAALKMNLDMISPSVPVSDAVLTELRGMAEQCLAETRTLSHLLHPPLLDEAGFSSAASWYVGGFSQRSGMKVAFHVPSQLTRLPARVETVLFRVLQESLTNIHRHSESSSADIELSLKNDEVELRVTDFGRGIPPDVLKRFQQDGTGSGIGLAGMRERVKELGGTLQITSDESGTTVLVTLPTSDVAADRNFVTPQRASAA